MLGWPWCGIKISRCAVALEIYLLRWTLHGAPRSPHITIGKHTTPSRLPCYHPWRCSETRSTSGLYHHPVRSTWVHRGRCWQALSWWTRTVLKRNHSQLLFHSSTDPLSLNMASPRWLQHSLRCKQTRQDRPSFASCSTWYLTWTPEAYVLCTRLIPEQKWGHNSSCCSG